MRQTSRRQFLQQAGLLTGAASGLRAAQRAGRSPNVLFIVVDDLDCRIRPYGDPVALTPSLDRLAGQGVRFERAYCQFPLCNPTRSSVLSGRYPTSTGVLDNNTYLLLEPGQYTLPNYFQRHGYSVADFGKVWHDHNRGFHRNEPIDPPPLNSQGNRPAPWFTPEERARQQAEQPGYWDNVHSPYRNMAPPAPSNYAWANEFGPLPKDDPGLDSRIAGKAIESMQAMAAGEKPFFLAVGFHKPHVPLKAPKEYFDLYDPSAMRLPPDFDTEPRHLKGYPRDEFRQNIDLFAGRSFSVAEAREAMRAYYACISYTDAQIGRLLDKMKQLGVAENTIVVLWGDHGWHLGEKGMWAKGTLFETSARGPMLIADPRLPTGGKASPRVVQYLDMYPTLVELCDLPAASWLEGASLAPLLRDPLASWEKPAYTVQTRNWFIGKTVRTERWRYTEWDEGRRGIALFDHQADPHEMRNLAAAGTHKGVVEELQRLLRRGPLAARP